jgi:serine/threonine protein kinase
MSKKKLYLIPDRIDTIEKICNGPHIDSIVDFKNSSKTIENTDVSSSDIRELLPKKYIDFNKAIGELGGRLLYIKSGSTGHTFKGVHLPPNIENKEAYAVKVVAYPKKENYGDMYNIKRPENVELLMIKLLSYFVINKQTPHIILPITTFNTSIKPFLNLSKDDIVDSKKFDVFLEKYNKGEYYNNVSVLISEWANAGDLLDYIRKHYKKFKIKEWRTIFFQFLSVLAIIQAKYPAFRHNDLKANNLLVQVIDIPEIKKKHFYRINNQTYVVPNIGFQIKLWDFDFACIENIIDNSKVDAEWTTKINITSKQNRYYDVHYFFNTLYRKGFFPEFLTDDCIPVTVKEFVSRVVPEHFKTGKNVSDRGRILINEEYLTPDDILKNDVFFKIMRKNDS